MAGEIDDAIERADREAFTTYPPKTFRFGAPTRRVQDHLSPHTQPAQPAYAAGARSFDH
ncbi:MULTISPECIES: hypothetical protein [Streptomyces]|uniref:hypothetical protein n=1 Tax=Streptomyces TaxID=1883 RepID=UPI0028AD1F7F|nr:hypothetical protein [Streptomyces parvus]